MLPYIKISDSLILYSYPIMVGMGLFASKVSFESMLKSYKINLSNQEKFILMASLVISSFIGAKVLFILSQNIIPIEKLSTSPSFWLGGGLVFYGAPLLTTLLVFVFSGLFQINKFDLLASFLTALCLGHAFGRIGCFLAGCCFGHLEFIPVQLIEACFLFLLFLFLKNKLSDNSRNIILTYFSVYAIFRFFIEFLRGDELRGFVFGVSTSQFISLWIFGICVLFVLIKKLKRNDGNKRFG